MKNYFVTFSDYHDTRLEPDGWGDTVRVDRHNKMILMASSTKEAKEIILRCFPEASKIKVKVA